MVESTKEIVKILFYIESLDAGGKERRLVELIKGLQKHTSFRMLLVLMKKKIHYTEIFDMNCRIQYTERKFMKKDPSVFVAFNNIVKEFKPDIIHVWGSMTAFYSIPAKILNKVYLINSQIADAPLELPKKFVSYKLSFLVSDRIIANSKAGLNSYNAPMNKSTVIYNGFDFKRIKNYNNKERLKEILGIETTFVVGMVASFSENKDYHTYLRAAIQVLRVNKNVTFLCVGKGDYSLYTDSYVHDLSSKIKFLGKRKDIESIINICDIGVLISNAKVHGEGISNALLEFMAHAKPIIANDCGGTKELLINEYNGYLLEGQDENILAEKILKMIEGEKVRKEMGALGRKRVHDHFSIERMIDSYVKEYNNATLINN